MGQNVAKMLRRLQNIFDRSTDAFDLQLADGTTNRGDLGSHYAFDPETYRLYRDGAREFLQYDTTFVDTGSTATFDDTGDTFTLKPAANEQLTFQTANRFRYVVMYESQWAAAWKANRPLQTGESITLTLDASEPGVLGEERHGIEYDANGARQFITRNGTRIAEREVRTGEPVTSWKVYENTYNWYNVGRKVGVEYYGDGEEQQRTDLGTVITDRERGPAVGNGRVTFDVQAGGASDLEVEVGSMGFRNLGQVVPKTRAKGFRISSSAGTAGAYVPIAAFRVDPNDFLVTTDLLSIEPLSIQGDTDFLTIAVDSSKTDATGFDFPAETNGLSSSIQSTTNVTTLPDETGTVVTSTATPGGYQINFATSEQTGTGQNTSSVSTVRERRRRLHDTDVALLLAKADTTGAIEVKVNTEQEK